MLEIVFTITERNEGVKGVEVDGSIDAEQATDMEARCGSDIIALVCEFLDSCKHSGEGNREIRGELH